MLFEFGLVIKRKVVEVAPKLIEIRLGQAATRGLVGLRGGGRRRRRRKRRKRRRMRRSRDCRANLRAPVV